MSWKKIITIFVFICVIGLLMNEMRVSLGARKLPLPPQGQIGRFQMHPWRLGEEPYNFFVIDTTSGEIWWFNRDETRWQRQAPALRTHLD